MEGLRTRIQDLHTVCLHLFFLSISISRCVIKLHSYIADLFFYKIKLLVRQPQQVKDKLSFCLGHCTGNHLVALTHCY